MIFHLVKVIEHQGREWLSHAELVRAAEETLLAFGSGEVLSVIMENGRNVFGNIKERMKTWQEIS